MTNSPWALGEKLSARRCSETAPKLLRNCSEVDSQTIRDYPETALKLP